MEIHKKPNFKHLQSTDGVQGANSQGGKFRLPAEFNSGKFASGFFEEGVEVDSKKQPEIILGTKFTAPGWTVWTYPENDKSGKKHPLAGQTHRIADTAGKFVLMYRLKDLQQEINEAYASVGNTYIQDQVEGNTTHLGSEESQGIIGNKQLPDRVESP